jgi:hypothetical protein
MSQLAGRPAEEASSRSEKLPVTALYKFEAKEKQLAGRPAEEASSGSEKLPVTALYKFEAKEKQPFPPDPHGWFSKTLNTKPKP